jgi:CheY-like chemotaxis protein
MKKVKTTVLLGNADADLQILIADHLADEGFQVRLAKSREEIVANFKAADLLLVDARMGGPSAFGIETVARLVEEGLLDDEVPLIFFSLLTANNQLFKNGFARLEAKSRGYIFLQRPFELSYMMDLIEDELEKKMARKAKRGDA